MYNLDGKVALVTGAARGIGRAIALRLAAERAALAVVDVDLAGAAAVAAEVEAQGRRAIALKVDVTRADEADAMVGRTVEALGRIDILVNNAGIQIVAPLLETSEEQWERLFAVNVKATQRLIGYVAPLLGEAGRAVFFDDAQAGRAFFGHYGATKAAQVALARSWAAETARIGPGVAILAPQPMATAMRARFHPGEDRSTLATPEAEAARLLPAILG